MNRVRLLPEQVANQIAAGEVVERPASVVKELVENSLDAGATRITVEVTAAGRSLIRVSDDGCGMSRDDALLCLERHATSKISTAADLARIATMGFRGEALPSIASISRFILTTREHIDEATGSQVVINGGRIAEVRESGIPPGTVIEVRGLFFNVPARRKFLRSDETERAHIQHWLTTAALAHPEVAFVLLMEGRTIWHLPALPPALTSDQRLQSLRERLRLLLGDGLALVPLSARGALNTARILADPDEPPENTPPAEMRLWGWIGAPGVSRGTRDGQHLFVNRRPVENRGLSAAMIEGYHNALMKGRFPLACLFLELDPGEVDVNIHPAKREVKFHRERDVRHFVADAVRQALKSWHSQERSAASSASVAGAPEEATRMAKPVPPVEPASGGDAELTPRLLLIEPAGAGDRESVSPPVCRGSEASRWPQEPSAVTHEMGTEVGGETTHPPPRAPMARHDPAAAGEDPAPMPLLSVPLRLVGVIGRLYVVLESDRGLVLLDQHAAHERVLYEQMLRRLEQSASAPSQRLLLPETVELSPKDAAFIRENLPALARLGVGLSEFGERTFLLDALPPFVKTSSPRRFALELADELRSAGSSINAWRLGEAMVAKTVCRHAVKANDPLTGSELEGLVEDLRQCEMPYTCPHGRPTLIEMSFRELEKKFGRIQG
jgi:DNA mismatch repair protein MutL